MTEPDGLLFVDESKQNTGQFGGVCAVSVKADAAGELGAALCAARGDLREVKFNELGDGRHKRAALGMIKVALEFVSSGSLKIDTLTWDRSDSRHAVKGRDDYANLGRMLYHRLVHVLLKWPALRYWHLSVDQQDQLDERELSRMVNGGVSAKVRDELSGVFEQSPEILLSFQLDSKESEFIQLADLFAGFAVYFRTLDPRDYAEGSKAKRNRAEIIDLVVEWMARTSRPYFREGEGLITRSDAPLTFWAYRPQGDYDRAPLRGNVPDYSLFLCSEEGCPEVFSLAFAPNQPLCPSHYADKRRIEEEAEARVKRQALIAEGSHYCEECFVRLTPTENMKRLDRRYEYEYRHRPGCGGLLIELDPFDAAPDRSYAERDRSAADHRSKPDVRLPRQNYEDE